MNKIRFFLAFSSIILSFSCSLNYMQGENSEGKIPEFSFTNANYTKYESNKKNVSLKAGRLEQYKSDDSVFVKNAEFETFDDKGEKETGGECDLISANSKNEIYTLFGNINLTLPKQDMTIKADSLNFNKKTEQITSSITSEVRLTKKDIEMSGYGFSASGVSRSFSFADTVSGTIVTNDEKNEEEENAE